MHSVIETPAYLRLAADLKLSETERARVVDTVAADPLGGDLVRDTGGVRKARVARDHGGKRGGLRVFWVHVGPNAPAYLLAVIGKSERENLGKAERNALAKMVEALRGEWKEE